VFPPIRKGLCGSITTAFLTEHSSQRDPEPQLDVFDKRFKLDSLQISFQDLSKLATH
jgi:hypothetical protein